MHGLIKQSHRLRQSPRRRFRNGNRAAALRAFTGAGLYANGLTLACAAMCCGSCTQYVRAAVILRRSEDAVLIDQVLAGYVDLQRAAARVKRAADLVAAYRAGSDDDRIHFARTCDTNQILEVLAKASA